MSDVDDKRLEELRMCARRLPAHSGESDLEFLLRVIDQLSANIDAYEADGEVKS